MQILIHHKQECNRVAEFFSLNQIDFQRIDFYTNLDTDPVAILPDTKNTLCVVDAQTFQEMFTANVSLQSLEKYCKNNVLWVYQKFDLFYTVEKVAHAVNSLDEEIKKDSIVLFHDCEFANHNHVMAQYKNIKNIEQAVNHDFVFFRIPGAYTSKNTHSKDFLLTTVIKGNRQHRDFLKKEFDKKPYLYDKGLVRFHAKGNFDNWLGNPAHLQNFAEGNDQLTLDMELYRNIYFEIVPETFYKDMYMVSEKITKAFYSKTPFVVLSSPGYLKFLQRLGFQTFNKLIDESYDSIVDLELRTKRLVETAEHIIENNSAEFYKESASILEHNYNVFASLVGQKEHLYDLMFQKELDKIG